MFKFNANENIYEAQINGILFECEDVQEGFEEKAEKLASLYNEKLPEIVEFILPDICEIFGDDKESEMNVDTIIKKLGKAIIDIDLDSVIYCEQQFDDIHIFTIQYEGLFDKFLYFSMDG